MRSPLVDITVMLGVQSQFGLGARDPWGQRLAGQFADLFVYGDQIRFPSPDPSYYYGGREEPDVAKLLRTRDPGVLEPVVYSTREARFLDDGLFSELVRRLPAWATNNRKFLRQWLDFQKLSGRMEQHKFVFTVEGAPSASVDDLARRLKMTKVEILYTLDSIARYPWYGEIAGDEFYLNHFIRNAIQVPTMKTELVTVQRPAIQFADAISAVAPKLTFDKYTALLHELRGEVRSRGLHLLRGGDFDPQVARDIAIKVGLPPKVKHLGPAVGISSGVVTGLGAIGVLASPAALAAAAITVASVFWKGHLPASVGQIRWLHWAVEWDLESQSNYSS